MNYKSVALSTYHICLVENFSAQWREDIPKTPNVSLGCFGGLDKKRFMGNFVKHYRKWPLKLKQSESRI